MFFLCTAAWEGEVPINRDQQPLMILINKIKKTMGGWIALIFFLLPLGFSFPGEAFAQGEKGKLILSDFSKYPENWDISGDASKAKEIYQVVEKDGEAVLQARGNKKPIRIFKKISWDPQSFPVLEWKWRVKRWPEDSEAQVYVYVSLDKDIFGIPTLIKYTWSKNKDVGTIKEGGFFRPIEMVLQSGKKDPKQWIAQRVSVLEDFQKLIGRDPRGDAYGIGFLVDQDVEVEIGEIYGLKD